MSEATTSNRGKQFVCWLDRQGRHHDVALRHGDKVWFRVSRQWWLGTFHCLGPSGKYIVRIGRRTFYPMFTHFLQGYVDGDARPEF